MKNFLKAKYIYISTNFPSQETLSLIVKTNKFTTVFLS